MKVVLAIALAMTSMLYILIEMSCGGPSSDDVDTLNIIKYKNANCTISFDCDLYLKVVDIHNADRDDVVFEIYNDFFYDKYGKRRKTSYVYLNYYGNDGRFRYQLSYDSQTGTIVKSRTEHY